MVRNYNNLSKEITLTGFFSEYLPSCFKLPDSILLRIPPSNCDVIAPLSFNMSRFSENNARRTLFIPEIGSYLATYQYMRDNHIFQELIEFTESTNHSFSPILDDDDNIFRHEQSYGAENTNSDINEKSEYIKNISKKIKLAAGAKKTLKLDISNCFSSFYMHMIPAILLGAEGAEENYNKHNKNPEDETISTTYLKYCKLDSSIRRQNLNRTNGLLTGTLFSKIISEAILTRIDKELDELSIRFVRYVDDYEIFIFNEEEKTIISYVTRILKKYGFSLNSEKTEIIDFPYYVVKNFRKILNSYSETDLNYEDIIEVFNTFFEMEALGTKGAIRYLLKWFEQTPPQLEDTELYKSYLLTIMANDSRSLTKSCSILINEKDKYLLSPSDIQTILGLLKKNIDFQFDLEVIWLLYLLIETDNIDSTNPLIKEILLTDNELAQMMLLNKNLLDENSVLELKNKATSWILNYELFAKGTITLDEFIERLHVNQSLEMYKKLKERNIHFISFES